ncbi:unnamed protein product [[Candida] boidinii]|nr:unnamed protein product [[Candida] boidinii]
MQQLKRDYLYNYFHSSKNKNQVENEETIFTTDEVNDESNNNENNTEEEKTVAESQDITHEDDIQSTDGAENHQLDTNPSYFPSFLRKNLFYQAPTSAGNSIAETIIDREALRKELLASLGEGERREAEERYGAYFQEKQAVKELRDSFVEQTNHVGKWVSGFFNRRAALPTFRKATKEIEQVESESETPEPEPEPEYDYESKKDSNPFFMPDEPPIEFNEDLLRPSASIDREPIDDVDMNKYKRHVTMEEIDAEIEQYEKQKQLKKQLEELEQQEFEKQQLEQTPEDVNSFYDRSDFESLDENSRFEDKEIAHKENIREHWSLHTKQTIKDKFSQLLDYPGYLSGSKESNHQKYVVERQD